MTEQLRMNINDSMELTGYNEKEFRDTVIKNLMKNWLNRYADQKFISTNIQPKITSSISDMPSSGNNQFRSVTEMMAIRSADAKRFLEVFHEKLLTLPGDYQNIIEKKYLQVGPDGKWKSDEYVYPELHLSRTAYFNLKPKALYWLGLALLNVEY